MTNPEKTYSVSDLTGFLGIDSMESKPPEIDDVDLTALIQSYQKLGSCFFMVVDLAKMSFIYVSPSTTSITGHPSENWMEGGLAFSFSIYHPDEMIHQKMVHQEIIKFHNSLPVEDRIKYRYCYNMNIRRSDGKYIKLLGQMICLKTDERGRPRFVLQLFTDITLFNKDNTITLTISKFDEKTGFSEIEYYFVPEEVNRGFSQRESEINRMILTGLNSREIAVKLNLSRNTIDTYRKKIRRKLGKTVHPVETVYK
jgi:hypothetical protein